MTNQANSNAVCTLIIPLLMSLSIYSVRSVPSIEPSNDTFTTVGGAAIFVCKGDPKLGILLESLQLRKTQIYNNSYAILDQPRSFLPVAGVQNKNIIYDSLTNTNRTFVSYVSTNTSIEVRTNLTGLLKEDTATYSCWAQIQNETNGHYEFSSPVSLIVYDRQPNVTLNLVADIPIFKDNSSGSLVVDASGVQNLTVYCNSSAVSLSPDIKLLVGGTDVATNATKKVNVTLTGATPYAQIKTNEISTAYTLVVANLSGLCTTVTCSGYLPQYLGNQEIASKQFTVKKGPGPCPTLSSSTPTTRNGVTMVGRVSSSNDRKIWLTSVITSTAVLSLNVLRGL